MEERRLAIDVFAPDDRALGRPLLLECLAHEFCISTKLVGVYNASPYAPVPVPDRPTSPSRAHSRLVVGEANRGGGDRDGPNIDTKQRSQFATRRGACFG